MTEESWVFMKFLYYLKTIRWFSFWRIRVAVRVRPFDQRWKKVFNKNTMNLEYLFFDYFLSEKDRQAKLIIRMQGKSTFITNPKAPSKNKTKEKFLCICFTSYFCSSPRTQTSLWNKKTLIFSSHLKICFNFPVFLRLFLLVRVSIV